MNLPDAQFGGGIVYQLYDNGSPILTFTDGTIAGTRPFLPASVPVAATNRPFVFEGNIIFVAADPQAGSVLWRTTERQPARVTWRISTRAPTAALRPRISWRTPENSSLRARGWVWA